MYKVQESRAPISLAKLYLQELLLLQLFLSLQLFLALQLLALQECAELHPFVSVADFLLNTLQAEVLTVIAPINATAAIFFKSIIKPIF